jgi:plasmid stabilization system protein ParE
VARRVSLSDQAARDLDAIYRWQLQLGSGATAKRRLQAIRNTIQRLGRLPCLHARGEQRKRCGTPTWDLMVTPN